MPENRLSRRHVVLHPPARPTAKTPPRQFNVRRTAVVVIALLLGAVVLGEIYAHRSAFSGTTQVDAGDVGP